MNYSPRWLKRLFSRILIGGQSIASIAKGVSVDTLLSYGNIEGIKMLILLLIIILVGFGASTAYLIPWSLLPDAIDQDPEKPSGI